MRELRKYIKQCFDVLCFTEISSRMKIFNLVSLLLSWVKMTLSYSVDVDLVVDVIKSYERPTAVVAKLCWRVAEKRNLMARLMDKAKPVKILYIDEYEEIEKFDPIDMFVLVDLSCHNVEMFLNKVNLNSKFKSPSRWFFITEEDFHIVPKKLRNYNILVNSEALIYKMENNTTFLKMVYRIDSLKEFRIENYGNWTKQNGIKLSNEMKLALSIRRKDLQGKPIATSLVARDKKTQEDIDGIKNKATDHVARLTYHHVKLIYDFMNATKVLMYTDTWGYYINDSWNGMIGDIVDRDADLCGTVSFMRLDRINILMYLSQPIPLTTKFVFREPSLSFQNNLYVLPFKSTVWMCIGALILILIVIIYANAKWEASLNENKMKPLDPNVLRPNVSDIAIFIVSAMTQQGSSGSSLKGTLGRVVTFIMFLIFLFLYTSYAANIVALLQSSSDQIRTLSDLLNSRFEIGVEDEPYARYYFTRATDPVKKALYETKIAKTGYKPNFMNIEEGVLKVRNKDAPFAFHMNLAMGYKKVEELFYDHEKCDLQEIEYIPNSRPWLCCRKVSSYTEIYKIGAARINEHGLCDRMNRVFYVFKIYCNTKGGSFDSVNMIDFHPVLLWLVYGMTLAFVLLGVENFMYRKLKRKVAGRYWFAELPNR